MLPFANIKTVLQLFSWDRFCVCSNAKWQSKMQKKDGRVYVMTIMQRGWTISCHFHCYCTVHLPISTPQCRTRVICLYFSLPICFIQAKDLYKKSVKIFIGQWHHSLFYAPCHDLLLDYDVMEHSRKF